MKIKKILFILFILLLIMALLIITICFVQNKRIKNNKFIVHRVAHAGGGIDGQTYTNSLEALDLNIKKGFLYFELDFVFTKDGYLVCLHDWEANFMSLFGFNTSEKLDLETFNLLVKNNSKFEQCSLDTLISWMERNPNAIVIADVKEDNLKALQIMSENVPDFERRIIPQIYDPANYYFIKEIGYEQAIWTLYEYGGSNEAVLKEVDEFEGPFAVTMNKKRASSDLPTKLKQKNIPTYVHTVNEIEEKNEFIDKFNVTEIYTDFLAPDKWGVIHSY